MTPEELTQKEEELALRETNLRKKEIEMIASEVEFHKAMADLKEEKLTYQSLVSELALQKSALIQICKDIEDEYD